MNVFLNILRVLIFFVISALKFLYFHFFEGLRRILKKLMLWFKISKIEYPNGTGKTKLYLKDGIVHTIEEIRSEINSGDINNQVQ